VDFDRRCARYAPVSLDIPLISNLNAWQNIALIGQYHDGMSQREGKDLVLSYFERLELQGCEEKRGSQLSAEERFSVMFLRASMINDAIILICDPFRLLPHHVNVSFIYNILKSLDDLYTQCHIFDYTSNKDRYRTNDA